MAYGLEIRNEFGEVVTDFQKSLVIAESGLTKRAVDIGLGVLSSGSWVYLGPQSRELFTFYGSSGHRDAWAHNIGDTFKQLSGVPSTGNRFSSPLAPIDSTYFYQIGSVGLLHHSEHVIDTAVWSANTDEFGLMAFCLPSGNTPLPYIRVQPYSPQSFPEDYGMQIRNAANEVTFDSRADFISISEVRFVPRSTVANIMNNNAVVNLTLRTPVPNCYVASPNHSSHWLGSGSTRYRFMKIEQTSPTNIRLSRVQHGPTVNNTQGHSKENDTVLIIARNPFA